MNKTLMLVICDFLLLSMLALARFDPPEETPEATLDATASSTTSEAELISLLEESLKAEQTDRSNLSEDLSETQEDLEAKASELAAREAALEKTRKDLEAKSTEAEELAQTKAALEAEKARLAAEKADIEQQRTELSKKFEQTREQLESANTERVELAKDIGNIKEESTVAKERLSATEEKLLARELALTEREAELKAAQEEAQRLAKEREALNRALEVAKAESNLLQQNLSEEQAEKAALQAEKEAAFARAERLGENVSELGENVSQLGQSVSSLDQNVSTVAQTSEAIQKEMIEARPQTMSEIFTRFQNNRASIKFKSREKAVLSGVTERIYTSKSILLKDETDTHYLVTHHSDTPFNFSKSNAVLSVDLEVTLGKRNFPINQVGFLATDPRILFIPLPKQYVQASGLETFELAIQPERWEEAILVKNDESNFGRTEFRRLTSSAKFLKMDRPALGELFADFASSKGDLTFTKNARFIGVMTDSKHAVVIDAFLASGALQLSANYNAVEAKATIGRLKDRLRKLPSEVR